MTIDESNGAGWPLNDIGGLARRVPEIDPGQYFDEQARLAYEEALVKWPVLARLMGLAEAGPLLRHSEQRDVHEELERFPDRHGAADAHAPQQDKPRPAR